MGRKTEQGLSDLINETGKYIFHRTEDGIFLKVCRTRSY